MHWNNNTHTQPTEQYAHCTMDVADSINSWSGAASTTGSHLDTSCCVYMDIQSSCTHPNEITVGRQRRKYGHLIGEQTSSPDHTKSKDNDHCQWLQLVTTRRFGREHEHDTAIDAITVTGILHNDTFPLFTLCIIYTYPATSVHSPSSITVQWHFLKPHIEVRRVEAQWQTEKWSLNRNRETERSL